MASAAERRAQDWMPAGLGSLVALVAAPPQVAAFACSQIRKWRGKVRVEKLKNFVRGWFCTSKALGNKKELISIGQEPLSTAVTGNVIQKVVGAMESDSLL